MSSGMSEENFEKIKNLKEGESYVDPESNAYQASGHHKYPPEFIEKVMKCISSDQKPSTCQFCKEQSYYEYDLKEPGYYNTSICLKCHIGFYAAVCSMIC